MTAPLIRGLTLIRPWATAIARGPKRVENRSWRPGDFPVGSLLAVHAGMRWSREDALFVRSLWGDCDLDPTKHPAGAIVALAEFRGCEEHNPLFPRSAWHFGPVCWELGRVLPLPKPVPARGAQGLWVPEPETEAGLRDAWLAALELEHQA